MSDDDLHDLIDRLQVAARSGLDEASGQGRSGFLEAQLANEAALAISQLVAMRALLLAGPEGLDARRSTPRH